MHGCISLGLTDRPILYNIHRPRPATCRVGLYECSAHGYAWIRTSRTYRPRPIIIPYSSTGRPICVQSIQQPDLVGSAESGQ